MSIFADSDYIGEEGLKNLRHYKYAAIDKSPISNYILKPYWNWAIGLFPMWMAPNLITLSGLSFVFLNVICIIIWINDLVGPARRTGTSSPLGELFDHGCDALNCTFSSIVLAASMGLGHSEYAMALLPLMIIPFYLSTWEEYHTGILYLGYCNGPTEGVLLGCLLLTISAITDLTDNIPGFIPMGWTVVDILLASVYIMKSYSEALSQLISITIYSFSTYLWLSSPNSYIFRDKHFILFAMTIGIVFGRMATKIILAHLTKMPFPNKEILTPEFEHYYLWAYFIFTAVAYLHWAFLVIDRFCAYLKIKCFRIPHHSSGEEAARLLHTTNQ
ncbi:11282_t:CDS:2 [Diversispora eburnea]|uniref:11282_t:CDS:1 n=1 Tax=Diversispora eburnea TaxID=1213867 RepID=A0A9N8WEY7_9GLOM|nr:11282_t:CDS:2 [Diversispora eburnea]